MKSNEAFVEEVKSLVGDEYIFLEEYKGSVNKIKVRHNSEVCGYHEYEVIPNNFLRGTRCPECFRHSISNTKEDFREKFNKEAGGEYTLLEEYKGALIPLKVRHNSRVCDYHEYHVSPNNFSIGRRCPRCQNIRHINKIQAYHGREFSKLIKESTGNELEVIGRYVNSTTYILVRHNIQTNDSTDSHAFFVEPRSFKKKIFCFVCQNIDKEK